MTAAILAQEQVKHFVWLTCPAQHALIQLSCFLRALEQHVEVLIAFETACGLACLRIFYLVSVSWSDIAYLIQRKVTKCPIQR